MRMAPDKIRKVIGNVRVFAGFSIFFQRIEVTANMQSDVCVSPVGSNVCFRFLSVGLVGTV